MKYLFFFVGIFGAISVDIEQYILLGFFIFIMLLGLHWPFERVPDDLTKEVDGEHK